MRPSLTEPHHPSKPGLASAGRKKFISRNEHLSGVFPLNWVAMGPYMGDKDPTRVTGTLYG